MANLSIKSKLLIMLLGVSALSIALVATLSYRESYLALQNSVFSHLTSLRASRADALERYIETISDEITVLSTSANIGVMLDGFGQAVRELENQELDPAQLAELEVFYLEHFLPAMDELVDGTPVLNSFFPQSNAGRYLQYHYLAKNPYPDDERSQLQDPGDGSRYSQVHNQWNLPLSMIAEGFEYFDLFLIDMESGTIVYSTAKEVDFGTSLVSGPYATSNLARLFRMVQRNPDRGATRIVDFEHYRPSFGAPAMFLAAPVFVEGRPVGVVAVQEAIGELNRVLTGDRQWERDGLGLSGETILIGADHTMRSASRFLIEDPEAYAEDQRQIGTSEAIIARILKRGSPILEQEVHTVAADQALLGQTGTGVIVDYRGREILGSWAPLKVKELDWAIVGKIDLAEAYAPIHKLARDILIQAVIILALITLAVMVMASSFVRPVNDLISRVRRFGAGDQEVQFDGSGEDEIGDLAISFQELAESARRQTRLIEKVSAENERLLSNILPRRVAQQVRHSNHELRETVPDVSVIFAEIRGLAEFTQQKSASECVTLLEEFIATADATGAEFQAELIKSLSDTYMAAVGLSTPLLDHMERAVEFARELRVAVTRIGQRFDAQLSVVVGISAGPVITNVVQQETLLFHLWGAAVVNADYARDNAEANQIVVTGEIREALEKKYQFRPMSGHESVPLWVLADE